MPYADWFSWLGNRIVDEVSARPLGLSIALLSIVLWVVNHYRTKRGKTPYYRMWSNNLVKDFQDRFKSIKILKEDGTAIRNLTVTKLVFWNAGKETLDMKRDSTNDPLRLQLKDGLQILEEPVILDTVNPVNDAKVVRFGSDEIPITFDYLGRGEGFTAEIVHDGMSNDDIQLLGTFKDCKIRNAAPVHSSWLFSSLVIIVLGSAFISVQLDKVLPGISSAIGITVCFGGAFFLYKWLPGKRPPAKLNVSSGEYTLTVRFGSSK